MSTVPVQAFVTTAEKAELESQAAAEGISVSLLIYRRVFNKPEETRRPGRKPKHDRGQAEELPLTG